MKTDDGINYDLEPGDVVRHITKDTVLREDMFVRPRYQDAWRDGGWDTTYKNEKWSGTHWHKLSTEMPGWIGQTYRDYEDFAKEQFGEAEEDYFECDIVELWSWGQDKPRY